MLESAPHGGRRGTLARDAFRTILDYSKENFRT